MSARPKVAYEKTHIVELLNESVPYTVYGTRWVPTSCRLVAIGQRPRATGVLQVFRMHTKGGKSDNLVSVADIETKRGLKCGTFQACDAIQRHIAVADVEGWLEVYDLNRAVNTPVVSHRIHSTAVNAIDGGGAPGPCELVTGSRDGHVLVSDVRTEDLVVARLVPEGEKRDCWAVTVGGTSGPQDRSVACGFDNGDVKLWDLRVSKVVWETNLRNGVASISFSDRTGPLKRLVCGCLSGQIITFDLSDKPAEGGYASSTQKVKDGATIWVVEHCPQHTDIVATTGSGGEVIVWQKERRGFKYEKLASCQLSTQPIAGFDWHPQKEGLCAMSAFDQAIRIAYVTHLKDGRT